MSRPSDSEHENDTRPFGFGDSAPPKREAPPLRIDKYDGHPDHELDVTRDEESPSPDPDPSPTSRPRKKKRKKRPDLLQRLDREPEQPWAKTPLLMLGIGLMLCLIPLIVLAVQSSDGGARAGAATVMVGGLLLFVGVLLQIGVMSAVMFGAGILFGIDYGPIGRGFLKLAAVIALIDGIGGGLALAFYVGCGSLGVLMAVAVVTLLTYALVQSQFELNGFETMVTVLGVMFATVTLSGVAAYVFLSKMAAKATAAG